MTDPEDRGAGRNGHEPPPGTTFRGAGTGVGPNARNADDGPGGRGVPGEQREAGADGLSGLVARARDGDRDALERVVEAVRDRIYNLAIRMLWHPEDAADATQEILIRIITRLDSYRGEAAFTTWAYRVAANHLLDARRRRAEREAMSFEEFGRDLERGRSEEVLRVPPDQEQRLFEEEVKIGCTQGMLLCLDRPHRLAYILGEVFEVTGEEGAAILDISHAAYRKRLSRARGRIRDFMRRSCGIVDPENPCRCRKRIDAAIERGRVDPDRLLFATHPARARRDPQVADGVAEMETLHRAAAVMRSHPDYRAPDALVTAIRRVLDSGRYDVLERELPDG